MCGPTCDSDLDAEEHNRRVEKAREGWKKYYQYRDEIEKKGRVIVFCKCGKDFEVPKGHLLHKAGKCLDCYEEGES